MLPERGYNYGRTSAYVDMYFKLRKNGSTHNEALNLIDVKNLGIEDLIMKEIEEKFKEKSKEQYDQHDIAQEKHEDE